jgi:hypothetical protein
LELTAEAAGSEVILTWAAEAAQGHSLVLERSADLSQWELLTLLEHQGHGRQVWTDSTPLLGKSAYRLRSTDSQGLQTMSEVREVLMLPTRQWSLFPNPAQGQVKLVAEVPSPLTFQVCDATGRTIRTWTLGNGATANLDGLAEGVYWVRCLEGGAQLLQVIR